MTSVNQSLTQLQLEPANTKNLKAFVGELNGNLKILEKSFGVKIFQNGNKVSISGGEESIFKGFSCNSRFICINSPRNRTIKGSYTNGN